MYIDNSQANQNIASELFDSNANLIRKRLIYYVKYLDLNNLDSDTYTVKAYMFIYDF